MLVSLNWLKEFVEIDRSAEEIADLLTMGGIEVESISRVGADLRKVLTARIVEVIPHPSSEKLHLAVIATGAETVTVVCGAPNIKAGQVVPYAPPGSVLPSGLEVAERSIRGVTSPGMLCSEKELGLGEDESGIMVLDESIKDGLSLTTALPFIEDVILETSVTPNRGDCLSVLGIAREIAALTSKSWRLPEFEIKESSLSIEKKARIEIIDSDLCPRYVARVVQGVKIGRSPLEIRLRLARSGIRPISNVVDATNLVLLECGQPLHAFDYDLLEEGRIVVRRSDPGEVFVTLDNQERRLPPDSLMIRDGKRSVALAGIMGGQNSEILDSTGTVLLESACFERFGIRRTAKALGMNTEASFRFERGVDPENTLWAANRVAYIIQKIAGGEILRGYLDSYPEPIIRPSIAAKVSRINTLLGLDLSCGDMEKHLLKLGIEVAADPVKGELKAVPPSWRWDLEREVDLAEETARIHGFQNIPLTTPQYTSAPDHTHEKYNLVRNVANIMNSSGYTEIVSMSFISKAAADEFKVTDSADLDLINPLIEDYTTMRSSLIPGLLAAVKRNFNFRIKGLKLYEIGKRFIPVAGEDLPREDLLLAAMATGSRYPELWNNPREYVDFFDIKGALENLLEGLGVDNIEYVRSSKSFLHPGKSADVMLNGIEIGYIGEFSPTKLREHDLNENIYTFEILLEPLFVQMRKKRVFTPLPRYPYIERDLSFIVEEKVSGDAIKQLISRLGHDIIASVILFDLYRGESIPRGRQSMAFRIRYQSEDRTLTDEEVQEVHSRVVESLVRELGVTVRE